MLPYDSCDFFEKDKTTLFIEGWFYRAFGNSFLYFDVLFSIAFIRFFNSSKVSHSKSTIKPSFDKKGGFIFFKKVARIIRKHIDLN